jgi:glycosyltransferase involved in cell wall biosynthesis
MARRVLYLVNCLTRAGTERNVAMLCKHIDKERYCPEVWVINSGTSLEREVRDAGIKICQLHRGWKWNPFGALRAARQIARAKFDILHAFLPTIATYAALAKLLYNLPQPMIFRCGWSREQMWGARWRYRWLYRRAFDLFVANSPSAAAFLESMGIQRDRIRIIPNGHETEPFRQTVDRRQIRNALGIDVDAPLLIYVGRFTPSKRVEDLIDALALIVPHRPDLRAVLVGDGPERPQIARRIERLHLEPHVMLLGVRDDVLTLLKSSDLFVFPSEEEGLPNAVIEACLAGLPIVACDVPGVRDVVQHRETALLAMPRDPSGLANCIEESLDDLEGMLRRAETARRWAESTYHLDSVLSRLYELYDSVLRTKTTATKHQPASVPT